MKVMLLGLGAVGAPLSTRLYLNCDFSVLLDEGRKRRYDGVSVNGVKYVFPVAREGEKADLIIVACKNFHLPAALDLIEEHVKKGSIIISLLNGVESEHILEERFKESHVLYSFITSLSSNREGTNINCFCENGGVIYIGEKDNTLSKELLSVKSLFDISHVSYKIPEDIVKEIWWKFLLNTCFNSLSGLIEATYAKMYDNEHLINCARLIASEVRSVAALEGVTLTKEDSERAISTITRLTDDGKTSLLQDIEAKRQTENDYFTLSCVKLGKKHGVDTPLCAFLYELVEAKSYAKK